MEVSSRLKALEWDVMWRMRVASADLFVRLGAFGVARRRYIGLASCYLLSREGMAEAHFVVVGEQSGA